MFTRWLRGLSGTHPSANRQVGITKAGPGLKRKGRRFHRPSAERLEDRLAPAGGVLIRLSPEKHSQK